MTMLQAASSKKRTFICIDALDECVAGDRAKILDSLNQILRKSPSTRIFVTGRPHIRPEIGRRLAGKVASLPISPKRDDIIRYLHSRLGEDTTPDAMDSSLEADILKKIPENLSEIFLLVSLKIDAILQEATMYRRRQKIISITDGLGLEDAYGATLDRIKEQGGEKSRLGMAALMWISYSERPLKAGELCHALAVEIGSANLNSDYVPSIGTLLACGQGLFVVDKEGSTARLIHFTLQEYLRGRPKLFGTAHATMAETCLSYLNSQQVQALSASPSPDLQYLPFLEYSSLYWGTHAKREYSDGAKSLVLNLFDYSNHISTKILLKAQISYWYAVDFDKLSLFSGLHCASLFRIVEIAAGLIEVEGCDINKSDCAGNAPLVWAAHNGHEGVVKILLGQDDVNPDKPDQHGQTPLCRAARNGQEGVVKILLRRDDIDPDKRDKHGLTPLGRASLGGHEGVVKILLGRGDINPDKPDNCGRTPLWWAAWDGREEVVKILLGRDDVNPNKLNKYGVAPLCCAAQKGHEGVVKILLGRGEVDPDKPDDTGRTPLWWAAWHGREEIAKILLERGDVNPSKPDNSGRMPLWWAAWKGHEEMVKILIRRDDIIPDKPDKFGQTPL